MCNKKIEKKTKRKRVTLNSIKAVRLYLARKIRDFENDPDRKNKLQEYRMAGYLASKLIEVFRVEKYDEIENRIKRLEEMMKNDKGI